MMCAIHDTYVWNVSAHKYNSAYEMSAQIVKGFTTYQSRCETGVVRRLSTLEVSSEQDLELEASFNKWCVSCYLSRLHIYKEYRLVPLARLVYYDRRLKVVLDRICSPRSGKLKARLHS